MHLGIIGHITSDELNRLLTSTEAANGFANRFLWIYTERSKALSRGGGLNDEDLRPFAERIRRVRDRARTIGRIDFDTEAGKLWDRVYEPLSDGNLGLRGAVIGRAEAQVVRLATLYALLDSRERIGTPHLNAALAVWGYAEASARFVFGDALGDETADCILSYLKRAGANGATRTEINRLFAREQAVTGDRTSTGFPGANARLLLILLR